MTPIIHGSNFPLAGASATVVEEETDVASTSGPVVAVPVVVDMSTIDGDGSVNVEGDAAVVGEVTVVGIALDVGVGVCGMIELVVAGAVDAGAGVSTTQGGDPSHGRVSGVTDPQALPAPDCATATDLVRVCVPPSPHVTVHALQAFATTTQSPQPAEHDTLRSITLSAQPAVRCATAVVIVRVTRSKQPADVPQETVSVKVHVRGQQFWPVFLPILLWQKINLEHIGERGTSKSMFTSLSTRIAWQRTRPKNTCTVL